MTFDEAKGVVLIYGKYRGKTIDEAARTDDGLLHLDRMLSTLGRNRLREAIDAYLSDPAIRKDLEALVGDH